MEFTDLEKKIIKDLISNEYPCLTTMGKIMTDKCYLKEKGIVFITLSNQKICLVCLNSKINNSENALHKGLEYFMQLFLLIQRLDNENLVKIWTEPELSNYFVGLDKNIKLDDDVITINEGEEIITSDFIWLDRSGKELYKIFKVNAYFEEIQRFVGGVPIFSSELVFLAKNKFQTPIELAASKTLTVSKWMLGVGVVSVLLALITVLIAVMSK